MNVKICFWGGREGKQKKVQEKYRRSIGNLITKTQIKCSGGLKR